MNPHFTYLLIDTGILLFPLIFAFNKKIGFHKKWRALLPGTLITAAIFIGGDVIFTAKGIWWFSDVRTLAFRLLGLPIEEWLFFIITSYACSFIAAWLDAYFPPGNKDPNGWRGTLQLAVVLVLFGVLNYYRVYTFAACAGCGLALMAAWFLRKKNPAFRVDRFLLVYAICLLPFLIISGPMTALPIILYNDAEIIGVRIYSIPVENIFSGMLLVLGNNWVGRLIR